MKCSLSFLCIILELTLVVIPMILEVGEALVVIVTFEWLWLLIEQDTLSMELVLLEVTFVCDVAGGEEHLAVAFHLAVSPVTFVDTTVDVVQGTTAMAKVAFLLTFVF